MNINDSSDRTNMNVAAHTKEMSHAHTQQEILTEITIIEF